MVAPGTDILGAAAGGGYRDDDGTSFAAPLVAGAAALIFSALPAATTSQVIEILLSSADDLGDPGRDDLFGAGRLNLFKAMRHARFGSKSAAIETKTPLAVAAVPNPFRAQAGESVLFSVPPQLAGGANPRISIFDLGGLIIKEGEGFSWDGRNALGSYAAPGVYFVVVRTDRGKATGRVIVDGE